MKRFLLPIAALLLLTLGACNNGKREENTPKTVKIDTLRTAGGGTLLQYPGKVKAAQDIDLSFKVSGTIKRYYVKEGERVRQGQLLVALDPTDYEVQLAATEAEYRQIKNDAERVMAMYADSAVTPSANDKAVYGLKQITAKYQHHKDQLAYTRLTAPFDGYVQNRLFEAHETVGAGMPVLAMMGGGMPEVEISLPAVEYIRRNDFTDYRCTFDVFPGKEYRLKLISITPMANANQLYTMRLQLISDKQPLPSPGMNTMVSILCSDEGREARFTIPGSALLQEQGKTQIFVYNPINKKVRACDVSIIQLLGNGDCIISGEKLQAGEMVVASGVHRINDGETVKPLAPISDTNVGGLL